MMHTLALAALVVASDPVFLDGKGERAEVGAVAGAAVASGLVGVAMFGGLIALTQTPESVDALLETRQRLGALPFTAGLSLISMGASGIGAGVGHVAAGGAIDECGPAVGGAVIGATMASAVGAVPSVIAFAASDRIQRRTPTSIGDAIGSGIVAGLYESVGLVSVTGSAVVLVPPVAAAGALLASAAPE